MVEIKDVTTGQVLHRGKNLRVVLEYTRKHPIIAADYNRDKHMAMFEWEGAYCYTDYADPTVFEWFLSRRRSWGKWVYKGFTGPWTVYYYVREGWMDELPQ